ncbi:hypothetical protein AGMMS49938_05670 [Fibrobacterales bacterium]|nr:hypothetical protein AGMMS49938_05670 [Fibrobacterales bacterium]
MKKDMPSLQANAWHPIFIFVGVSLPLALWKSALTSAKALSLQKPILWLLVLLAIPSFAKEGGNPKEEESIIKLNGVLEVGFDINDKVNKGTTEYNKIGYGQIGISARPVKKLRAEFDLEYDKKDSLITIDKLYAQYNFANFGSIRAGYMKKSFGLEEGAGLDERYFHKRSIVNDGLENFNIFGHDLTKHDLTLQYRHEFNKEWKMTGGISWTDDSLRFLQNYAIEYETKKTNLILAALIGHYTSTYDDYNLTAFATSLSFRHSAKLCVSEAELIFGNNPVAKIDENKKEFVFGARVQEYFPFEIPTKILTQIVPIAEAAFWTDKIKSDIFETQLRAGLTFGFTKKSALQWRNTYGTILKFENGNRELKRRRFDTEAVVIF